MFVVLQIPKSPALSPAPSESASKKANSAGKAADRCSLASSETIPPMISPPSSSGSIVKNQRKHKAKVRVWTHKYHHNDGICRCL